MKRVWVLSRGCQEYNYELIAIFDNRETPELQATEYNKTDKSWTYLVHEWIVQT